MADTQFVIEYTLSITVKRAVRPFDYDATIEATAEWMAGLAAKRELEREVLRSLRAIDGDCDCEVILHVISEESI